MKLVTSQSSEPWEPPFMVAFQLKLGVVVLTLNMGPISWVPVWCFSRHFELWSIGWLLFGVSLTLHRPKLMPITAP